MGCTKAPGRHRGTAPGREAGAVGIACARADFRTDSVPKKKATGKVA